jgi:hypothetical protein
MNQKNEPLNPFAFNLEKILTEKNFDQNSYFLILTIYFYLKQKKFDETADILFNEAKLDKVFIFPQELNEPKTDFEKLKLNFLNFFYFNTYINQANENSNFLSDYWNQFWENFVNKIKQSNKPVSLMDKYLSNKNIQLTCKIFRLKL